MTPEGDGVRDHGTPAAPPGECSGDAGGAVVDGDPDLSTPFCDGAEFVCGECGPRGRRLHVAVSGCEYARVLDGGAVVLAEDGDASAALAGLPPGTPAIPHVVFVPNMCWQGGGSSGSSEGECLPWLPSLLAASPRARVVVTCRDRHSALAAAAALGRCGWLVDAACPAANPFASPLPRLSPLNLRQCTRDHALIVTAQAPDVEGEA